jgi:hypothetical protein
MATPHQCDDQEKTLSELVVKEEADEAVETALFTKGIMLFSPPIFELRKEERGFYHSPKGVQFRFASPNIDK